MFLNKNNILFFIIFFSLFVFLSINKNNFLIFSENNKLIQKKEIKLLNKIKHAKDVKIKISDFRNRKEYRELMLKEKLFLKEDSESVIFYELDN
mgnify:CR=1 FL=1